MRHRGLLILLSAYLFFVAINPLPAFAVGEDDPMWQRPSYEKKISKIGRQLMEAGQVDEAISFRISYRHIGEKNNVNASAQDLWNVIEVESGLLKFIESDDQIAFILGHEIGHIIHDHGRADRKRRMIGQLVATPISMATLGMSAPITRVVNRGIINTLSQKQELEADREGFRLMVAAGYDPKKSLEVIRIISGDGNQLSLNRSHPLGSERLQQLRGMIGEWESQQNKPSIVQGQANPENKSEPIAAMAVSNDATAIAKKGTVQNDMAATTDPKAARYQNVPDLGENETMFDP